MKGLGRGTKETRTWKEHIRHRRMKGDKKTGRIRTVGPHVNKDADKDRQ